MYLTCLVVNVLHTYCLRCVDVSNGLDSFVSNVKVKKQQHKKSVYMAYNVNILDVGLSGSFLEH